jgi:hypothetical protein
MEQILWHGPVQYEWINGMRGGIFKMQKGKFKRIEKEKKLERI